LNSGGVSRDEPEAESLWQRRGAVVHALSEPIRQWTRRAQHRLASLCQSQLTQLKLDTVFCRASHGALETEKAERLCIDTGDPQVAQCATRAIPGAECTNREACRPPPRYGSSLSSNAQRSQATRIAAAHRAQESFRL
jgi:hypothetical protein